jgi:hypothetical protein
MGGQGEKGERGKSEGKSHAQHVAQGTRAVNAEAG